MHRRECTHVRLTHTHTTRTNAIANTVRHWYKSNARTLFDSRVEDQSSFVLIEHISRSKVRGGIAVTIVRLGTLHNSLHLRRYLQIYYRSIYMIWSYRSELPSSHDNTPHAVQSDKIIFSLSLSLTHSFTHSLTHSFTYSLTHSFTHSLIHSWFSLCSVYETRLWREFVATKFTRMISEDTLRPLCFQSDLHAIVKTIYNRL